MPEVACIAGQGELEVMAPGVKGADELERDAFDDGINRWNDGSVGNYYGSFNCTDYNNDTICDQITNAVFNIPGGSSVDLIPKVG